MLKRRKTRPKLARNTKTLLEVGALKYRGKPCPKGHDGLRYASSNRCVYCSFENNSRSFVDRRRRQLDHEEQMRQLVAEIRSREKAAVLSEEQRLVLLWFAVAV